MVKIWALPTKFVGIGRSNVNALLDADPEHIDDLALKTKKRSPGEEVR